MDQSERSELDDINNAEAELHHAYNRDVLAKYNAMISKLIIAKME